MLEDQGNLLAAGFLGSCTRLNRDGPTAAKLWAQRQMYVAANRLGCGADSRAAVATALRLKPDSDEAHLARARHLYQGYLAYEPALAELASAREALPNDSSVFALAGYIYRRKGR